MTQEELAEGLLVLYASQTGNAEWIAKHIASEAQERGFKSSIYTLNDHAQINWTDSFALVIVLSTTGDGDPPDNATQFWRFLRRSKPDTLTGFKGRKMAILGLGDTNYTNFCNMAKRLDKKLSDLGAVSFMAKGLADDGVGLELVVDPWIEKLWGVLGSVVKVHDEEKANAFVKKSSLVFSELPGKKASDKEERGPVNTDTKSMEKVPSLKEPDQEKQVETLKEDLSKTTIQDSPSSTTAYTPHTLFFPPNTLNSVTQLTNLAKAVPCVLQVEETDQTRSFQDSSSLFKVLGEAENKTPPKCLEDYTASSPFKSRITSSRFLTSKDSLDKKVLELDLDVTGLGWEFGPGDAVGIVCPNPEELVVALLKRLGVDGTRVIEIRPGQDQSDRLWDRPWTSYELFKYHLNLHFPPSRSFIRMLSEYATDVEEKKMLLSICSKQGLSVYRTLAGQRPTLMDVLASFPSVSPPLSVLLDNLHRLQPRFYSIANSPLSSESSQSVVRIAFNIVDFECTIATEQTKRFQGLCTVWLEGLTSSLLARDIPLFPKLEHSFRLNTSLRTPVILVAGGTGIAPFIGFLQHLQKTLDNPREDITVMLIYGHRDKSDVLYATEIDSFVQSGLVNVYIECLSRQDQPKDSEQVKYVQDGIAKEENKIWEWIDGQEGRVYVCGSVGLGSSVNGALLRVMQGKKQVTDKEAFEWLTVLASEKRLLRDLW